MPLRALNNTVIHPRQTLELPMEGWTTCYVALNVHRGGVEKTNIQIDFHGSSETRSGAPTIELVSL